MKSKRRVRSGFTLIELVVVVAILAILAGLVLPKLDTYILKANKSVSGSNISGVSRYIQTHRVINNEYPDKMDSLLTTAATPTLWTSVGLPGDATFQVGLHPELTGGNAAGLPLNTPKKLKAISVPADSGTSAYGRSLNRMGLNTVYDVDPSALADDIPGNQFGAETSTSAGRTLSGGSSIAVLNIASNTGGGGVVAAADDGDAAGIWNKIYGSAGKQDSGAILVAFGFGPKNTAIGTTLQDVPFYPNLDQISYYNRFVVFYEIYANGDRASFKLATGADGDLMADEIREYYTTK